MLRVFLAATASGAMYPSLHNRADLRERDLLPERAGVRLRGDRMLPATGPDVRQWYLLPNRTGVRFRGDGMLPASGAAVPSQWPRFGLLLTAKCVRHGPEPGLLQ